MKSHVKCLSMYCKFRIKEEILHGSSLSPVMLIITTALKVTALPCQVPKVGFTECFAVITMLE